VLTRKRRENGGQRRIASDKTPESILIVDDNESNLRLMEAILSTEDYEVGRAVDAEDALRLLEDWRPRLILMDIQLPGIDGLELTRRLKLDPSYKTTAIVALTAYAMKGDEEKARAAGCDGYITKPVDTRTLPDLIAKHLGRAATHSADPEKRHRAGKTRQSGARP
jgi:CheY-like chemotaxis protein